METEMLDGSKKEEGAMKEEERELGEQEKEKIQGKQEKEAKLGEEQCFICDAPAVFNCPACSQVPICENHQDYHQAKLIFTMQCCVYKTKVELLYRQHHN